MPDSDKEKELKYFYEFYDKLTFISLVKLNKTSSTFIIWLIVVYILIWVC